MAARGDDAGASGVTGTRCRAGAAWKARLPALGWRITGPALLAGLLMATVGPAWSQQSAAPEDGTRERPAAAPSSPGPMPATPPAANLGGTAAPGPGPAAGAGIATESQARGRIEDAGYAEVSDLRRGADGTWSARARREGRAVGLTLDGAGRVSARD